MTGSPDSSRSRPASRAGGCRTRPAEGTGCLRGRVQRVGWGWGAHLQGSPPSIQAHSCSTLECWCTAQSLPTPGSQRPAHRSAILCLPESGALSVPRWYRPPEWPECQIQGWRLRQKLLPGRCSWSLPPFHGLIGQEVGAFLNVSLCPAPYPEFWAPCIC